MQAAIGNKILVCTEERINKVAKKKEKEKKDTLHMLSIDGNS